MSGAAVSERESSEEVEQVSRKDDLVDLTPCLKPSKGKSAKLLMVNKAYLEGMANEPFGASVHPKSVKIVLSSFTIRPPC